MVAAYGGAMTHATVNGVPATPDDLVPLAFGGYAHYTSMQVRDGRVHGLAFHLERLRSASLELFGVAVPDERVRGYLRASLTGDASVTVHLFAPDYAALDAGGVVEPSVLVRVRPPVEPSPAPVRVRTARFGRYLPQVKNAATLGATRLRRQARADGYDDVLFVDDDGTVSEGSAWNVLFLDARGTTVFPVAPMLTGTTLRLIRAGLAGPSADRAVRVGELAGFRGAALTNSVEPARPVAAIDDVTVPVDDGWLADLRAAFAKNGPEVV
jgi:branched-subunit amino acid aminotransferase/4-amino-4-deoxychorismate lyase